MSPGHPLPRDFFARPADVVAPALLGHILSRTLADGSIISGRIVETEAYLGPEDRASHAFNGRRTPRNESMYAAPGTCYIYLTYGLHWMCNVACLRQGHPAAVLIRALEPLTGLDTMRRHRPSARDTDLCSGPAKLCQALAITRDLDALDLITDARLRLIQSPDLARADLPPRTLARTARVGVDACGDWAEAPLRWFLSGNPHVSPGRPSRNASATPPNPSRPAPRARPQSKPRRAGANRAGPASERTQ